MKSQEHPWDLVWGQPYIDSERLVSAIEAELSEENAIDFRGRLLIRDAMIALRIFQGSQTFSRWLNKSPVKNKIEAILKEDLGEPGFTNIGKRLVSGTSKTQVEQIFELLGKGLHQPLVVYIAGSIPSLLSGLSSRPTDDIDFVDEVPREILQQRKIISDIETKYGFTLGHVQSHYLPSNWKQRSVSLGQFGALNVLFVDEIDIFVSKLSSKKEKHKDDLRVLAGKLNKDEVKQRLQTDGRAFLQSDSDRAAIEENWSFVYREPLGL